MAITLFAVIKRSSSYAHQQPRDDRRKPIPFEVEFSGYGEHIVRGNSNQYRLADLDFFAKYHEQMIKLVPAKQRRKRS